MSLRWAPTIPHASSNTSDPSSTRSQEPFTEDDIMAEPVKEVVEPRATRERGELEEGRQGVEEDGERSWNR